MASPPVDDPREPSVSPVDTLRGTSPRLVVRPARQADADAIRTIYNHEVLSTTATFDLVPRTLEDQQQWLAARSGAFTAIVAVDLAASPPSDGTDGEVVGFAALSPYRERAAYRTSVEDSVYVRRDRGGQGIGTLLLQELLDIAEGSGFHSVFARIEATGEASRALHARCGFRLVGIERETGRKFNRWLDVALMQCLLHERHQR
ncbi:MAG: GNAT family N-acetyltransferase [Actinobacteria bacterium]|nr:GNAT family N-acetyltransferase [Actinomycetota bacterium]